MKKLFYEKQLIVQRIEAHRAVFGLEARVLRAEIDARTGAVRQVLRLGRLVRPLVEKLRRRRRRPSNDGES